MIWGPSYWVIPRETFLIEKSLIKLVMGSRTVIASKSGCYLVYKLCQTLLWPHELGWPTRLLCPWDSPGKNTGAGCRFHLLGVFLTQGLNQSLLHWRQILYHCVTYCEANQVTDGAWKASSSESQRPDDWKPVVCCILSGTHCIKEIL